MLQIKKRGNRIRASDKSLVFRFAALSLSAVFIVTVALLNIKQLMRTDWHTYHFIRDGTVQIAITPYVLFTIAFAGLIRLLTAYLYYRFCRDSVKQFVHRQKLARMILENKWYETEQIQDGSFFTDPPSAKTKEKISYFPKMYYRMKHGLLHIQTEKELHDSYVEYTLLYDMIANRISIEDVQAAKGKLRLMKNVWWEYDKLPHMLSAGGTGGGKTYFILTIIEALLRTNARMYVLDPKNADLADLSAVML